MSSIESMAAETATGADEIGSFIGKNPRQTHHLLSRGLLPGAYKIGRTWHLNKPIYAAEVRARAMGATSAKSA